MPFLSKREREKTRKYRLFFLEKLINQRSF
jgi:hypothetical protein